MKVIQKSLSLDKHDYYVKHLNIVSCLLPTHLTKTEIEVLASFLSLDKYLIEEDMFNSVSRKKVMEKMELSPGGLSNHLRAIIDKKVIDKNEITNRLKIKSFLLPRDDVQGYQIKIINNEFRGETSN